MLEGRKRATASSVAELEAAGEPVPAVGDLSILLDGAGHPRALSRTTRVDVVPMGEVTEEFAALEGEDDGTLESWRREHTRYWTRVLAGSDVAVDDAMPVVCERFEVLYPREQDR